MLLVLTVPVHITKPETLKEILILQYVQTIAVSVQ